ncbi:MAG: prepilin-type N-terminal cleavage/methylation domain-containing protein [Gemmatimonadetes bacterium]|nr:prepilin-type N-terminal cleavage/methylation domain-containing protein [Gemmatimonadota bacterium]
MPRRAGFTLIELLVVILVISVLAMIGLTRFWSVKDRSLVSAMQTDLRNLASEQENYFATNYTYATTLAAMTDYRSSPGVVVTLTYTATDGWAANTTHVSLVARQCGLFTGNAPAVSGAPATINGIIDCN